MATQIFSPLSRYAQKNMEYDLLLSSKAPWLRGKNVTLVLLWLPYIWAGRYLPAGVPERALASFEWQPLVAIP